MPHREVRTDPGRAAGSTVATLGVDGAAENNLRDLSAAFGPGLTTVVGVSGSGKSSLIFDVVYHEARRGLLEALALASPWSRVAPAGCGGSTASRRRSRSARHGFPQPELHRGPP